MMIKISPEEFKSWSEFIFELAGIVLTPAKTYLIENRLGDLLLEENCPDFGTLYLKCRFGSNTSLRERVISLISTQETSFFRDGFTYEALIGLLKNKIIPKKKEEAVRGSPPCLKIWSAACSHGQEPYSLAMTLVETIQDIDAWDVRILASDIADNAFNKAGLGRYTELEVRRGLDDYYLDKYFHRLDNHNWQVNDRLRAMLHFKKINLVSSDFQGLGPFDLIFCRNVAIYFDHDTKKALFDNLAGMLAQGGRLFLGATETLSHVVTSLKPVRKYNALYYTHPD